MGSEKVKPINSSEKKRCIKFEDEDWKPTRAKMGLKRYPICKERKGTSYMEEYDVEVDLDVVEFFEKTLEPLDAKEDA